MVDQAKKTGNEDQDSSTRVYWAVQHDLNRCFPRSIDASDGSVDGQSR